MSSNGKKKTNALRKSHPKSGPRGRPKTKNSRFVGRPRGDPSGLNKERMLTNPSGISHHLPLTREKIGNVDGSETFSNLGYVINPGNSVMFPVFSNQAICFEQYKINHLAFIFKSEAYTASGSNVSAGKVVMVTNANVLDALFLTDTEAENYYGSRVGAPFSGEIQHVVVRNGRSTISTAPVSLLAVQSSENQVNGYALYDYGMFQFITALNASNGNIGELYVEYSFEMYRPRQPLPSQIQQQAHIMENPVSSATSAAPLGTSGGALTPLSNVSGLSLINNTTFCLADTGQYLVSMTWYGTAGPSTVPTVSTGENAGLLDTFVDANDGYVAMNNATTHQANWVGMVNVFAPGLGDTNYLGITGMTSLAGASCDIFIIRVYSGFANKPVKRQFKYGVGEKVYGFTFTPSEMKSRRVSLNQRWAVGDIEDVPASCEDQKCPLAPPRLLRQDARATNTPTGAYVVVEEDVDGTLTEAKTTVASSAAVAAGRVWR
jgi:hypothetical protein